MGAHRLEREYDVETVWTTFPLHPEIPEEGLDLKDLFAGRSVDLEGMFARLRSVAAELELPLAEHRRTYNTRRAQELSKWAQERGAGDAFRAAVYHACFAEGRNIGKIDELVAVADRLGLSADEAREVLVQGRFGAPVDSDWHRARTLGIRAVPTLLVSGRRFEGLRPYEELNALAEQAGIPRRHRPDNP
ncbi:MAG: DsbA family protein [Deltaproteobacteria bacterium]|nr:DsbA family protein [Deltaproteobacteria bacterium]